MTLSCSAQPHDPSTLAFAAGSIFDVKSGRMIELEQRSPHRQIWASDDQEFDIAWPTLEATLIEFDSDQSEIAVAVGMTHAIGEAVADYVRTSLPAVGKLLVFEPTGGPAFDSVICGRHASMFAQQIAAETRKVGGGKDVHMFIASPNALAFFLGQRRILMGPTILYEYDFENARSGSYIRSLSLPMVKL